MFLNTLAIFVTSFLYYDKVFWRNSALDKLRLQLEKLNCRLAFPTISTLSAGHFDNSGIDKNFYLDRINQYQEENSAKLHELDLQLLEEINSYPYRYMESGISSRQQARFQNAKNTKNIDTPISVAKQMLLSGLKNSLNEIALV